MNNVIECNNVIRKYTSRTLTGQKRQTIALDDISFQVTKGIVFGLLGPNGAGKTTTIRVLSTLLIPDSGKALVAGFDVVKEASKVRRKISLILGGERGLYGRLTGKENLLYFAALNHLSPALTDRRINEVLAKVDLTSAANRPVEQYSRGMRQRLHVARGLLSDPEIIFMDEPTIGLDPVGAQELRQMVPELTSQGKTILLTTHYMSEADELSNRIAIIDKGKIIASGTPSEIKRQFSQVAVMEVLCRRTGTETINRLNTISGIERIITGSDGPIQKLTIHTRPGLQIKDDVEKILGRDNIDSIVARDPTLEEAYLSIFGKIKQSH
jgi:ABC-2 type transport system ATP-binding protein